MGTYTTNYNLFMPSIGEQGWGELVNGNFTTVDTTMAGLDNSIEMLETKTDTMQEKLDFIEINDDGSIDINGIVLKDSGTITVAPTSTIAGYLPYYVHFMLLSPRQGVTYTGSLIFKTNGTRNMNLNCYTGKDNNTASSMAVNTSDTTLSFNDIPYLIVQQSTNGEYYIQYNDFTFT